MRSYFDEPQKNKMYFLNIIQIYAKQSYSLCSFEIALPNESEEIFDYFVKFWS